MQSYKYRFLLVFLATILIAGQQPCSGKTESLLGSGYSWQAQGSPKYYSLRRDWKSKALKVDIYREAPETSWLQLYHEVNQGMEKGNLLQIRLKARSQESLHLIVAFGGRKAPYEKELYKHIVLQPKLTEYTIPFVLSRDIPERWGSLALIIPRKKGSFEIQSIELQNQGSKSSTNHKSRNDYINPYAGISLDKEWWLESQKRIESIRKKNLTITVTDSKNNPVPGARIKVTQERHKFNFGTAIGPKYLFEESTDGSRYRELLVKLFNCVTFENDLKWLHSSTKPSDTAERMLTWCREHELNVRGHNLLSPRIKHIPADFRNLDDDRLKEIIKNRISTHVEGMKSPIYVWDVINEAAHGADLLDRMGEGILFDAFKWARMADDKVALAYNDYHILNSSATLSHDRRSKVFTLLEKLKNNTPLDTIGIQGHMSLPLPRGPEIWSILEEFEKFDLPLEITEYSFPVWDDKLQAAYLEEFLTAIFSHSRVKTFVLWGFWEGNHYRGSQGAGLIRKNWKPRPAMKVYEDLVFKKWWTSENATTDGKGCAETRVFLGRHKIQCTVHGKTIEKSIETSGSIAPETIDIIIE